jgi:hypothetical protein
MLRPLRRVPTRSFGSKARGVEGHTPKQTADRPRGLWNGLSYLLPQSTNVAESKPHGKRVGVCSPIMFFQRFERAETIRVLYV